jgi:C1A family cysteine protease
MAKHDFSGINPNRTSSFSAFGGQLLTRGVDNRDGAESAAVSNDENGVVQTLSSFGIEDAEQLVAIATVPSAREQLQSILGMKDKKFAALLEQANGLLPKARAAQVNDDAPQEFGYGVLPPTAEIIEAAERSAKSDAEDEDLFATTLLPDSVNLIPFLPAIRHQGGRSTCVAFVLTALNEYVLLRRHNIVRDLSEQHLYFETKQTDGAVNQCGTWQTRAITALQNRGQTREQIWAYNPNLPCNNHGLLPPAARSDGMNHRLQTITVPPRNVLAHKSHIASHRLVTLSFPVYNSWQQSETRRSGRITMRIGGEPVVDLHAVCLVGYQDNPRSPGGGFFIVRNSWSTAWGSECPYGSGYGTIPYQYIADDALEAFTAMVPAVGGEDAVPDADAVRSGETVMIEVGSNIKITISSK